MEHGKRKRSGISLHKFAGAKKSRYDKKARLEKAAALNAKRVNKYRKLTAKLEDEGQLRPVLLRHAQTGSSILARRDPDVRRARSRAGPAPGEEDSNADDDMVGEPSSSSGSKSGMGQEGGLDEQEEVLSDEEDAADAGRGEDRQTGREFTGKKGPLTGQPSAAKAGKKGKQKPWKPPSQVELLAEKVEAEKSAKKAESMKRADEVRERQKRVAAVEKQRKKQKGLYLKKTKRGQPVMKHRIDKILGQLQA